MATPATLYSVKIASPRDVAMESLMTCDVIRAWNAAHALSEGRVLLPLSDYVANAELCDMLVAFLHPESGTPVEAMEHEIDAYLAAGRPVFVYSSEARSGLEALQGKEKGVFSYVGRAVVDAFTDEKEFRSKFAQQLQTVIQTHPAFQLAEAALPVETASKLEAPGISMCAQNLLIAACEDPEAYIGRLKDAHSLKIQVNGQQLVPQGDAAALAKWDAAFNEILEAGYLRDAGCHGRLFQISEAGFKFLASIGKKPIGYIAELGSV